MKSEDIKLPDPNEGVIPEEDQGKVARWTQDHVVDGAEPDSLLHPSGDPESASNASAAWAHSLDYDAPALDQLNPRPSWAR